MSVNISIPKSPELKPRIVVIGVGGAGGNAVNNMIDSGLNGVEFLVANTDAQALALSKADRRIQMGGAVTQGLGAGMRPEVGEEAAEISLDEIMEHLEGTHMLFIAAGMGGGTGTGAAPVIARAARDKGILTVAIATKPFQFEGSRRMKLAEVGIEKLYNSVDTLIVIPNQNLFRVATESTTMADAFSMADEVLNSGVRGVTDLMVVPGLINLDFADVRTVMNEMGKAMMGTGEATGERRAMEAAERAIANPLLDDVSLKGAKAVLINITGGTDLTLYEVDEAASLIRGQVDPEANIIVGSALDTELDGIVRISVVATGVQSGDAYAPITYEKRNNVQENHTSSTASAEANEETLIELSASDIAPSVEPEHTVSNEQSAEYNAEISVGADSQPEIAAAPETPAAFAYTRPTISTELDTSRQASAGFNGQTDTAEEQKMPEVTKQALVKPVFGFFGRKKTKPAVSTRTPTKAPNQTGDLFGADDNDELEIPSFLRRH